MAGDPHFEVGAVVAPSEDPAELLFANFLFEWMDKEWSADVASVSGRLYVRTCLDFDDTWRRASDGTWTRVDCLNRPSEYGTIYRRASDGTWARVNDGVQVVARWSSPASPEDAIAVLRTEAARLIGLHGEPHSGHRLIVPDGNRQVLTAWVAREVRWMRVQNWISRHIGPIREPLEGLFLYISKSRVKRERTL